MQGKFITIDGIDGSGKSTQVDFIRSWCANGGIPLVVTREPGGTKLGENIRSLFLDINIRMSLESEILLLFAARQQHLQERILPALKRGEWVLSDRFTDATYAYQGTDNAIISKIKLLEDWVQNDFRPNLTIILDTSVKTSYARISGDKDRMERKREQFFKNVRQRYLDLAQSNTDRYHVVDGDRPAGQISKDIAGILMAFRNKVQ